MGNKLCSQCTTGDEVDMGIADDQIKKHLKAIKSKNLTQIMIYEEFSEDVITRQPNGTSFMASLQYLSTCDNLKQRMIGDPNDFNEVKECVK